MNRLLSLVIVVVWAIAFSALVARDVLPYWRSDEPPRGFVPAGDYQVGLFDESDRRVGTTWVSVHNQANLLSVQSTTELSGVEPLGGAIRLPTLRLESAMAFSKPEQSLINFDADLRRDAEPLVSLKGLRLGEDFVCTVRVGSAVHDFSLDGRTSSLLTESLRPFHHLPALRVGQTWRLHVLDCLALLRNRTATFTTRLARVVGRETIRHRGRPVECFRIETTDAIGWADAGGHVLRQRINLPLLGTWELRDEPFDRAARQRARQRAMAAATQSAARSGD
ncbi:MAG: hypothetical protein L6Q92_13000 [Phycisphaerae bacterium]|nr:hypothetical protein [Phycisphaerae bacterium]